MKQVFFALLIVLFASCVFAYVAPTTKDQPIIVESSSSFYGSDKGTVTIDLNLIGKDIASKDFFVRIKGLEGTKTTVKELSVNKSKVESVAYPVSQQSKTKISLNGLEKKEMQIVLEYDANEIGFGKEFTIILETKDGTLVADLDPFLSGYNYRQQWCLNTNGIGLSGNVTNDQVILFSKTSADTNFWGAVASDGDDVRFSDSSNNLYDFYFQKWDYANTIMLARVEVSETFDSSTDICGYLYYGNAGASNGQSVANTYNSTYGAVWHLDETSGTTAEDFKNSNDGTNTGSVAIGNTGQVGGSYGTFNTTKYVTVPNNSSLQTDEANPITLCFWANKSATVSGAYFWLTLESATNEYQYYFSMWADNKMSWRIAKTGVSSEQCDADSAFGNSTWGHFCGTFTGDTTSGGVKLFQNGAVQADTDTYGLGALSTSSGALIIGNGALGAGFGANGLMDEIKLFNTVLSSDEIKILYNTELGSFVSYSGQESGNNDPDINMTSPTLNLNWNGTKTITFNVQDLDATDTLDVNLYYSSSQGAKTNLIIQDTNLANASGITCNDYDFTNSTTCSYSWDTTTATDGQYYIDGVVSDGSGTSDDSTAQFRVDNTAPVTSFSGCTAGWHNTTQTITLSCADTSGSGCNGTTYSIDGGETTVYSGTFNISTDGNHSIDYNSIDYATNREIQKTSYCAYDATPPSVASPIFVGFTIFGGFINGVGTVLGGLATDILSGIDQATCEYTLNGGGSWLSAVWNTDHCEATEVSIVDGTDYNISTRVDDQAGNTGTSDYNGILKGDTTAPTTNDNASNDWTASNQTVTLTPTDVDGSGVKQTFYCVDEAGSCTPTTIGTSVSVTCTAGNICEQYVRYYSEDNVNNEESVQQSVLTRIDKENPVTTPTACPTGWNNTNQDVNFSCDDGSGAGCDHTNVRIDGGGWNEVTTINLTTDANHLIEYFSDDLVGNNETTKSFYCAIDKTAPILNYVDNNSVWKKTNFNINFGINTSVSGKASAQFRVDGGSWEDFASDYNVPITLDGNYYIDANITDNANNSLIILNINALLDKTAPTTSFSGCTSDWHNTTQTITLECSDSTSGCNSTAYRIDSGAWQDYSAPFEISTDGNHNIDYNSTDIATNIETTKTSYCAYDATTPTYSSIDGNGILQTSPFNVNVNGVNFDVSGKASAQFRVDGGSWEDFASDYNVPITLDGNYYIDFNFTDNAGNSLVIENIDANLLIETSSPPTITIVQPNGAEVYTRLVDTPAIILTLQDTDTDQLYIDVNYSETNEVGTGTQILLNENVLTSGSVVCDSGDFSSEVNCSFSWNITNVADGNYYIVGVVSDGLLDANDVSDADFTIASLPPITPTTDYVERYIAPNSKQRDTNIYYNPTSLFALSADEQQITVLKTIENNIFFFGLIIIVIIGILGWLIWKRK